MAIISSEIEIWEDDPVEGLFSPSLLSITYQLQMRSLFDKSNKTDVFFLWGGICLTWSGGYVTLNDTLVMDFIYVTIY